MQPPRGTSNHKIVLSYHGEIRVYCTLDDGTKSTPELSEEIARYKIHLLEEALGYKIVPLESIISHEAYEKQLHDEESTSI